MCNVMDIDIDPFFQGHVYLIQIPFKTGTIKRLIGKKCIRVRFAGVQIHHRHRVLSAHRTPTSADGVINKIRQNTVQIEMLATTLGFDDHRRYSTAMEPDQANRAERVQLRYLNISGNKGTSNAIHE